MERLRTVKFTVEIDTNKETYRGKFTTLEDVVQFYNETFERIFNDHQEVMVVNKPAEPPYSHLTDG